MMSIDLPRHKQFIFIIGSPRSGTTWLHSMLGDHPDVASIAPVELTHFSNYLPAIIDRYNLQKKNIASGINQGLPVIWDDAEFLEFLRSFSDSVYSKVLAHKPHATHIADKHPNYSNYTDVILKVYPNAKFIHMIRDGRDVVISAKSAKVTANIMTEDVGEMTRKWVKFIRSSRTVDKARCFEVKYEDVMAQTGVFLKQIFAFCGLSGDDPVIADIVARNSIDIKPVSASNTSINALRNNKSRLYVEKLTLEERYIFQTIGGDLMKEMGYCDNDDWVYEGAADRTKILAIKAKYKLINKGV